MFRSGCDRVRAAKRLGVEQEIFAAAIGVGDGFVDEVPVRLSVCRESESCDATLAAGRPSAVSRMCVEMPMVILTPASDEGEAAVI